MPKSRLKPSDRGRNALEPGPAPGMRAEQRDTDEQLVSAHASGTSRRGFLLAAKAASTTRA